MFICFIDLTAAYDKIPRDLLFRVLDTRRGCSHLISLLKAVYLETSASITGLRKSFPVKSGCRQGGIESPILFNIFFDTVCRVLDHKLKSELAEDYGIGFKYRIPNEASTRAKEQLTLRTENPNCSVPYMLTTCLLYSEEKRLFRGEWKL